MSTSEIRGGVKVEFEGQPYVVISNESWTKLQARERSYLRVLKAMTAFDVGRVVSWKVVQS